ncbi:hypothetical protein AX16_007744 [Volvariella volvacea WC 439]|nr:hypothetical protein AX16_007744 [Volvariella volvacea WC 439]
MSNTTPAGSVKFHIWEDGEHSVYLDMPTWKILSLSQKPLKWLRYVVWCIFNCHGHISETPRALAIEESIVILPGGDLTYYFVTTEIRLEQAIDLEIAGRHAGGSGNTPRARAFRENIREGDGRKCIFVGDPGEGSHAAHLIRHAVGSKRFQEAMRLRYEGDYYKLIDIDDERNGLHLGEPYTHPERSFGL